MMAYIQDKGKVIKTRETMNLPWEHFLPCREQWILSRRCARRRCGWCLRWCQNSNCSFFCTARPESCPHCRQLHMCSRLCVQDCLGRFQQVLRCDRILALFSSLHNFRPIGQIGLWVWSKQTWSLLNVEVETSRSEKTGIQRWFEQQRETHAWILLFFPDHWRYHTALWEKIKRVLCRLGCSWAANCWLGSLF